MIWRADAAAVLGLIAAGQDLELGDGVDADRDVHTAVVTGVDVADAVEDELILRGAGTVDGEVVGTVAGTADRVTGAGGELHAGNQFHHVEGLRPLTSMFSTCLPMMAADRSTLSVCRRAAVAVTSTESVTAPTSSTHVADGQLVIGVERDAGAGQLLESGGFDGDGVVDGKQAGNGEIALAVVFWALITCLKVPLP